MFQSTNKYYYTQSETIPLWSVHAKLGLKLNLHPDIKDEVEFLGLCVGTTAHKNIQSWKWHLQGTVIKKINSYDVKTPYEIDTVLKEEVWDDKQTAEIEFGSLTAFAINGSGVPTLQMYQINVN